MDLTAARTDLEQVVRESDAAIAALAYHVDDELDIVAADVSCELTEADREGWIATSPTTGDARVDWSPVRA
jgi:hypothetical protein